MSHTSQSQAAEALSGGIPLPLALPLHELATEPDPRLALWCAADLAEMILRFVVTVGTAEHATLPANLAVVIRQNIEQPTLGRWMRMARCVADELVPGSLLPELKPTTDIWLALLGKPSDGPGASLLDLRNRLAHAGPMGLPEAAALWGEWKPRLLAAALESLDWLKTTELRATDQSGNAFRLMGRSPIPLGSDESGTPAQSARLLRGAAALDVGPLQLFDPASRSLNVYFRHNEPRVQYIRLGEQSGMCDSDAQTAARFRNRFLTEVATASAEWQIPDIDAELLRLSKKMVGREVEVRSIVDAVLAQPTERLIWIWGHPGIGKSMVIAAAYSELSAAAPSGLRLAYRFRTGDERCRREPFLRFLVERAAKMPNGAIPPLPLPNLARPWKQLLELLGTVLSKRWGGTRVILFVDGIDEIVAVDEAIIDDVLLPISRLGVQTVLAGRPTGSFHSKLINAGALQPFPQGLPSLDRNAIRAMVLQQLPTLRRQLINAELQSVTGENPLVDAICQKADGLPIYVVQAINGLRDGSIAPEAPDTLPAGMNAFHEELAASTKIGTTAVIRGPILALLALAFEPLAARDLRSLLCRWQLLDDDDPSAATQVEEALAGLRACLAATSDGRHDSATRYTLYHETLREFLHTSTSTAGLLKLARKVLNSNAPRPLAPLDPYLLRNGVRHLMSAGDTTRAVELLSNFDVAMHRLGFDSRLPADTAGWLDDWDQARTTSAAEDLGGDWADVATKLRQRLPMQGWQAHQLLFQISASAPAGSAPHAAALAFAREHRVDWPWLETLSTHPLLATGAARDLGADFLPVGTIAGEHAIAFGPLANGWFPIATRSGRLFACPSKPGGNPRPVAEFEAGTTFLFNHTGDAVLANDPSHGLSSLRLDGASASITAQHSGRTAKVTAIGVDRHAVIWNDGSVGVYSNKDGGALAYPSIDFEPEIVSVTGSTVVLAAPDGRVERLQPALSPEPSRRLDVPASLRKAGSGLFGEPQLEVLVATGRFLVGVVEDSPPTLIAHDGHSWRTVKLTPELSLASSVSLLRAFESTVDGSLVMHYRTAHYDRRLIDNEQFTVRWNGGDSPFESRSAPFTGLARRSTPTNAPAHHASVNTDGRSTINWIDFTQSGRATFEATLHFPAPIVMASGLGGRAIAVADAIGNVRVLTDMPRASDRDTQTGRSPRVNSSAWDDQLWVVEAGRATLFTTEPSAPTLHVVLDEQAMPPQAVALGKRRCFIRVGQLRSMLLRPQFDSLECIPGPAFEIADDNLVASPIERLSDDFALLHGRKEAAIYRSETAGIIARVPVRFGMSVDGALLRDKAVCVTWESGYIDQWDLTTGELISTKELEFEQNFSSVRLLRDGRRLLLLWNSPKGGEAWIVDLDSPGQSAEAFTSNAAYPNLQRVGERIFNWSASGALDLLQSGFQERIPLCTALPHEQVTAEFLANRWFVRTRLWNAVEVLDCEDATPRPVFLEGPKGLLEATRTGIPLPARYVMRLLSLTHFQDAILSNDRAVVLSADCVTHLRVRETGRAQGSRDSEP
jgi:hypothetical protein